MKNAFKFGLKAFFGGCLGCFGALTFILILLLVITLVIGPNVFGGISSFIQSFSNLLHMGGISLPGSENTNSNIDMENLPVFEVFLTGENDPNAAHVETFSQSEFKQIWFWVRAPQGISLNFTLLMTMPDHSQVQFGPTFTTDSTGNPQSCGQFGDFAPQSGKYKLEAQLEGMSVTVGEIEFEITE